MFTKTMELLDGSMLADPITILLLFRHRTGMINVMCAGSSSSTKAEFYPVVGAHGTGKSTLLRGLSLSPIAKNVLIGQEIPRLICEAVGSKDYYQRGNNTFAKQIHLLFEQVATEVEFECQGPRAIVLDRSIIDHFAYTQVLFARELKESFLDAIINKRISKLCSRYKMMFYIPIEIPLVGDGTREADFLFQKSVDGAILTLLKEHFPNYTTITGSVETRVSTICEHLLT